MRTRGYGAVGNNGRDAVVTGDERTAGARVEMIGFFFFKLLNWFLSGQWWARLVHSEFL